MLARDLAQLLEIGRKRAFGRDDGGGRLIVRGLRLLHVGDGDEADLEALVGLLELVADRLVRGLLRLKIIARREYGEVRLADTLDQVLLGRAIVSLGLRHRAIRPPQGLPA